jgi:hypothetical protein
MREAAAGLSAILDIEMNLHVKLCAGWGLSPSDLEQTPPAVEMLAYMRRRRLLQRGDTVARVHRYGFGGGLYPAAAIPLGDRTPAVPDDEVGHFRMHMHIAPYRFESMSPPMIWLRTVNAESVNPLRQPLRDLW